MGKVPTNSIRADPPGPPPANRRVDSGDVRINRPVPREAESLFSREATEFLVRLARGFGPRRKELLAERTRLSEEVRRGAALGAPPEAQAIRESDWTVAAPAPGLETRFVELLGVPEARTLVRGLNSNADVFVADFEDLLSPTWGAVLRGHANLVQAVRRSLEYGTPNGDGFRIKRDPATLMVRPRGWHLVEPHALVDGEPIPAPLFDFGLYAFHNARDLVRTGTGPYLYLPKLEHYAEAALWQEIFEATERDLDLRVGTIRASAVIETLPATVQMDEILFQLRTHSAGLGFGYPGYTFSFLKQFRGESVGSPPDLSGFGGDAPFAAGTSRRLVLTCRRRKAPAISASHAYLLDLESGGPGHPEVGRELADKVRAAREGYDGTWVVHPGAVPAVREFFSTRRLVGEPPDPSSALPKEPGAGSTVIPGGALAFRTVRAAVRSSLRYLEARLRGVGTVVVDQRVEDASTVEISRTLLWTWVHENHPTEAGGTVSAAIVREILGEEIATLLREAGSDPVRTEAVGRASVLLDQLATDREFPEYLSLVAVPE